MINKHPKIYEDVFSSDPIKSKNKIKIEQVSVDGIKTEEYILLFKNFLKNFYSDLFFQCVVLSWLRRKFTYGGKKAKMPFYSSSIFFQSKFLKFLRRYVGHDIQIITKGPFFSKLETYYFDIFFPGFDDGNPFENPEYYKFPFENISLEYLTLVHQLDGRFDLLKEADKQKMSYAVFLDYVLNYTLVENDILGRDKYALSQGRVNNRQRTCYFLDTDKKFKPEKGSKRI